MRFFAPSGTEKRVMPARAIIFMINNYSYDSEIERGGRRVVGGGGEGWGENGV